jgi:predicted restriction endonuclease
MKIDNSFRARVLRVYNYRCAFSNYLKTHNLADNICVGLLKGYTDAKKT